MDENINEKIQRLYNVAEVYEEIKTYNILEFDDDFYTNLSFKKKHYEDILSDNAFLKIGVIGNFSSGKSLFINSILGIDLLGVDVLPSTSKITKIKKGKGSGCKYFVIEKELTDEKIEISKEITVDEYLKYSFRRDGEKIQNSSYEKNIKRFEIHIDNPILNYIKIYDTPGFSSDSKQDDELTKKSIKEFDVIFWLIDCNKGSIGEDELKTLKELQIENVYAIINKMDTKVPSERTKIIEEIAKQYSFTKILPYSALGLINYSKKLNEVVNLEKEINKILFHNKNNDTVKFCLDKNTLTIEQQNKDNIVFQVPKLNADFKEYYNNLYDEIMLLRQNSKASQLNRLYLDLHEMENKKKKMINEFIYKAKQTLTQLEIELEDKNNIYNRAKDNLGKSIRGRYESLRTDMFQRIFGYLFVYDGINKFRSKEDFPLEIIETCISESISNISKLYKKYLEEFISDIDVNERIPTSYSKVIDDFAVQIIDASINSITVIYNLTNFYIDFDFDFDFEYKNYIIECIDLAISDEEIDQIGYIYTINEINKIYHYTSERYNKKIEDTRCNINILEKAFDILK